MKSRDGLVLTFVLWNLLAFFGFLTAGGWMVWNGVTHELGARQFHQIFTGLSLAAVPAAIFGMGIFYGVRRISRPHVPEPCAFSWRVPNWMLIALVAVILAALAVIWLPWSVRAPSNGWFNFLLLVCAIWLPVLMTLLLALRGLDTGSRLRLWGALGFGFTLAPLLALLLEALAEIFLIIVLGLYLLQYPDIAVLFKAILNGVYSSASDEVLFSLIADHLQAAPMLVWGAVLYTAVAIAFIEEMFKPMLVWILGRRLDSPAQGFALGALSGAAFAFLENASVSGVAYTNWHYIVTARAMTPAIHIFGAALTGWGIALWRKNGDWKRFLGLFGAAVLLHSLWDIVSLCSGLADLKMCSAYLSGNWEMLWYGILFVAALLGLLWANKSLRAAVSARDDIMPSAEFSA